MKHKIRAKIVIVSVIYLVMITGVVYSQDTDDSGTNLKGEALFRYEWLGVNQDRGRFREDNWMTDRSTGGLDWLHLESTEPDENGYEWLLEGRALYDYDYRMSLLMKKQDSHYLKLDFSGFRRYFDGSNAFGAWGASLQPLAEISDFDLFVDRRNYNIELGLTPIEGPQWVFGWHRLVKDGKEVLLGGSETDGFQNPGLPPNVVNQRGITDTFYGEVYQTFADKYNFRIRQEWEQYHDNRRGPGSTYREYDSSGNVTNDARFLDDLGYTNWRTMFMFDSFLDDQTYVTANYMYNYLNSDSTDTFFRPDSPPEPYVEELKVGNSRRTNVVGLGYRRANVMQTPNLDFSAGVRIEDSKTTSQNLWEYETGGPFEDSSSLDEVRVAESLRLVYRGIDRTTLSFDADLEQRDLDWNANTTRSGSVNSFNRKTDTDFTDQVYTLKAVRRHNRAVKSTFRFRIKDLERSLTNLFLARSSPDYPGWLGSYRIKGSDTTLKTDFRINSRTSATLLYKFVQESIDFALGGKTSNQEIHRGAGSLSFSPMENLFLVGTFMLENRELDTPVSAHADGPREFDYRGNSYSLLLDGTYAFNERTSATLSFQHTEALGTVDFAGDYVFDKVGLMFNHRFAKNQTVGLGYQFYNFNNHDGGDWDDYKAHGVIVTYGFTF